ncbi:MAG TPA: glycosyl hydrolase [Actinomycetota bacterium]|nr:glycosyl hydrolase [Actinomycetota bacterium]
MTDGPSASAPRPLDLAAFRAPSREFGILPFWFLNGELDPDEMRFQLRELRDKGMHGVVFHGRYGLEIPYLSEEYLQRIRFGVEEANGLGLASWIYDEMNWPSGTADKRVLRERPDLAQRYIECVSFTIRGPWFMCLTGEDSRYLDFERSTPVAMFAIGEDGGIVDLTSNLSFGKVVPWEVPQGEWRLCYIVEKRADYYIDALDPEATAEFLRLGYDPYARALADGDGRGRRSVVGFYSDEPAMHYFLTAGDNPIVPWTKDMFRRFQERNGYDLRSRLVDLFFDLRPEAARTRHDFYNTTTELYADAYYRQIHDWCRDHGVLFTAHLLYEEWIRQLVRVEGNPFRHYEHMDVVAVDHLYPVIGTRSSPDQHVAMKLASSAAHHFGSERLICESFGGIFMDATMQRMKWIADWQFVLGVTVINPHGFHYTFEGARKRDWPPSMFYQYPWWHYYRHFSDYASRVSEMLTGGRHVAKVAILWPINAMFAAYLPQVRTADATTIEAGLNVLTDTLLRLHHDFDYLDEEVLARAEVDDGVVRVGDEEYELVILPPMPHVRASTADALERFVAGGGRVLGVATRPRATFGPDGMVDASERFHALLGAPSDPAGEGVSLSSTAHGRGAASFIEADPSLLATAPGPERDRLAGALDDAIRSLIEPDVELSNADVFVLHRRRDGGDLFFVVNTTFEPQDATVTLPGTHEPVLWDPSTGEARELAARTVSGKSVFELALPPVGSAFVVTGAAAAGSQASPPPGEGVATVLADGWSFTTSDDNALVVKSWRAAPEEDAPGEAYAARDLDDSGWRAVGAGAWAYQLPAEPQRPWPIPVWYRVRFEVEEVPKRIGLLVDGFFGDDAQVWLNGRRLTSSPVRSRVDSQMLELDLTEAIATGTNVLAVRLVLRDTTGGIVDHVKVVGSFAVAGSEEGGYRIVGARDAIEPRSWTGQGYPFLSGRGVYRTSFDLPEGSAGRAVLDVPMRDDALEVELNGRSVGVRLWDPYVVDLTGAVRPGRNDLALVVANTPANLLNGTARPSGIAGPPTLTLEGAQAADPARVRSEAAP